MPKIINIAQNSEYYSIILLITEQNSFTIRCVNISDVKSGITEYFVGFYRIEDITGEA